MGKKLCGNKSLSSDENREELISIVSKPKHFCSKCLRVASKKGYLCKPEKLLFKNEVPCCIDETDEKSELIPAIAIHSCEEAPKVSKLKKSKKKQKKKLKKEAKLIDLQFRMVD